MPTALVIAPGPMGHLVRWIGRGQPQHLIDDLPAERA